MFNQIRVVTDDTRHQVSAVRQLNIFPDMPFVLMAHIRRLQNNRFKGHIGGMWAAPTAPKDVNAGSVLGQPLQGVIECRDAYAYPFPIVRGLSTSLTAFIGILFASILSECKIRAPCPNRSTSRPRNKECLQHQ